jgi:hypothetical protein
MGFTAQDTYVGTLRVLLHEFTRTGCNLSAVFHQHGCNRRSGLSFQAIYQFFELVTAESSLQSLGLSTYVSQVQ